MKQQDRKHPLTEVLGYLLIMGVLTLGALQGYVKAYFKYQTIKMLEIVTHSAVNIQSAYLAYSDYGHLNTADVIKQQLFHPIVRTGPNFTAFHLQKGRIDIFTDTLEKNRNDNASFVIRMYNLTAKMCTALASEHWESDKSSGLVAMEINAQPDLKDLDTQALFHYCDGIDANLFAKPDDGYALACMHGERQNFPLTPLQAERACNCTKQTCMITWKYM